MHFFIVDNIAHAWFFEIHNAQVIGIADNILLWGINIDAIHIAIIANTITEYALFEMASCMDLHATMKVDEGR